MLGSNHQASPALPTQWPATCPELRILLILVSLDGSVRSMRERSPETVLPVVEIMRLQPGPEKWVKNTIDGIYVGIVD